MTAINIVFSLSEFFTFLLAGVVLGFRNFAYSFHSQKYEKFWDPPFPKHYSIFGRNTGGFQKLSSEILLLTSKGLGEMKVTTI